MRLRIADVLARLRADGLATTESDDAARAALLAASEDYIPWYIRLAVGLGAWAATAFLLGFIGALVGLENAGARFLVGAVLLGGAVWLRRETKAEFMRQSAVAASLAGQALIILVVHDLTDSTRAACISAIVLAVVLVRPMPDPVHRFLSGAMGAGAAIVAATTLAVPGVVEAATLVLVGVAAYIWRVDVRRRSVETEEMLAPAGYAVVVAIFVVLVIAASTELTHVTREVRRDFVFASAGAWPSAVTTLGITAAFLALVWKITDEHGAAHDSTASFAALAGVMALGAGALHSPGIVAGAAVLVLAFDRRNPVLLGLAVLFLLVFGSVFYYSLNLTLLEKSGVLVGSGVLLFAVRRALVSRGGGEEPIAT